MGVEGDVMVQHPDARMPQQMLLFILISPTHASGGASAEVAMVRVVSGQAAHGLPLWLRLAHLAPGTRRHTSLLKGVLAIVH